MRLPNLTFVSLSIMAIVLLSFSATKKPPVYKAPGVVQIDTHLYMDETEVTNFSWKEYVFWVKKVYGENSPEYKAALPDFTVWKNESDSYKDYEQHYYSHVAYSHYPVVGLSYEQMANFCVWRSDRVFEFMLVREDIIEFDTSQTATHHFSIENYFNGNYGNYKTGDILPPVPHYYLPSEEEWKRAEIYAQAIYAKLTKRQLKHSPSVYYSKHQVSDPIRSVEPTKKYQIKGALYNMHHNVSEQLADSVKVAGENWKGTVSLGEGETASTNTKPSSSVGFRCAFRWK